MDYEKGKMIIEALFLEDCPTCAGTGRIEGNDRCYQEDCNGGKRLNELADALVEFLNDHLTAFAEKDHGHSVR
jgi:DnaJ-class molecular chaperone